jgi:uncharacterized membrane protein
MSMSGNEWLELLVRWAHVFAGILWVGATYYFTWLDGRFTELEKQAAKGGNTEKFVWMVHSGGFYLVEKQKRPQLMPQTLHWFRWEAAITWLTGIFLFALMYYRGGLLFSADTITGENGALGQSAAIWLSVGLLIGGWVVYDLLWKFCKNEWLGIAISYALIVGAAWVCFHYFGPRGAYLQMGAMLGTIMAANVWMRILPPQRRMVAALKAGAEPNLAEAASAKARSKHNSFIVIPVVFMMLSTHYSGLYSGQCWLTLSGMVLLGWGAAKIIRRA